MRIGLGLGLTMRRGGGATFNPATLFAAGEVGAWYDPSDLSTMFQDSAGTIPAVVNQPVGRINDKSGNARHAVQATTAAKPVLRLVGGKYYLEFDGVDDWAGASFVAATFTATMDVMTTMQRRVGPMVPISSAYSSASYFGVVTDADAGASSNIAGTPSYQINQGTILAPPVSRDQLHDAWPAVTPVVFSTFTADLSTWTGFGFGGYTGFQGLERVYGLVARAAMTAEQRSNLRGYLAGKA